MNPTAIEDRASDALKYLTDTDELAADLKFEAEKAEHKYGATVDALFLAVSGAVEVRKATARTSAEAEEAYIAFLDAQRAYDGVANKRRSEALVIDWLRSLYSAKKQGS